MIAFIDDHRALCGVEPICRVLPIAPSTYHANAARRADPGGLPARAKRDAMLMAEIRRVHVTNFGVYGLPKVWRQLAREEIAAAGCTVARLMRAMDLASVVRERRVRTTVPDLRFVRGQFLTSPNTPTSMSAADAPDCTLAPAANSSHTSSIAPIKKRGRGTRIMQGHAATRRWATSRLSIAAPLPRRGRGGQPQAAEGRGCRWDSTALGPGTPRSSATARSRAA